MMALFPTEQNSKWHKAGFQSSPSEVDGWRSPQKPEGPSGRRCEDWTRRKELLFPDAGIVVRDRRIPPDTRLAGSIPCLIVGVHRDHHFALDLAALIRGVSDAGPLRAGGAGCGAGVRKPPKEETAWRFGAGWAGAAYGDFGVSDEALVRLRRPASRIVLGGNEDDERFRGRACQRRARAWRLEQDWIPCEDVAFLLRLPAGGDRDRHWVAANTAMAIMRCRS